MDTWKLFVAFCIEQLLFRSGILGNTIQPLFTMIFKYLLLPFGASFKTMVTSVFPYLLTDLCVILMIVLSMRYRRIYLILVRSAALCMLIYYYSFADTRALQKEPLYIQGIIYVAVGSAIGVLVLPVVRYLLGFHDIYADL